MAGLKKEIDRLEEEERKRFEDIRTDLLASWDEHVVFMQDNPVFMRRFEEQMRMRESARKRT